MGDRQPLGPPCLEATDDVRGPVQPHLPQVPATREYEYPWRRNSTFHRAQVDQRSSLVLLGQHGRGGEAVKFCAGGPVVLSSREPQVYASMHSPIQPPTPRRELGNASIGLGMLWRHIQSHWDYYRFVYAEESRFLWAFMLFVLGIIALPEDWVLPVFVGLAVMSAAALALDMGRISAKWRAVRFTPRRSGFRLGKYHPDPADAVQWTATAPRLVSTCLHPGDRPVEIWFDVAVDRQLQAQSPGMLSPGNPVRLTEVRLSRHQYEIPHVLAAGAAMALRVDRNTTERVRRPIRFNGRLLRLATEPTVAQLINGDLVLERVTRFDAEATNEIWRHATTEHPDASPVQEFVLDRSNRIRALENSRAANILGISIVAVTHDEQVIFVQQTQSNSIAPGALAVSGSGALDQADLTGHRTRWFPRRDQAQPRMALTDLVLKGMLRELREESLVRDEEIVKESAVVTGYFRWVDRAMKPEFTGLVRLACSAAELVTREQRGSERAFTQRTVSVPLADLMALRDSPNEALPDAYGEVSQRLGAGLKRHLGRRMPMQDGRAILSPSAEHAWFAAAQYLASAPQRAVDETRSLRSRPRDGLDPSQAASAARAPERAAGVGSRVFGRRPSATRRPGDR